VPKAITSDSLQRIKLSIHSVDSFTSNTFSNNYEFNANDV